LVRTKIQIKIENLNYPQHKLIKNKKIIISKKKIINHLKITKQQQEKIQKKDFKIIHNIDK
jgi:hypothetical protein